MKSLIKTCYIFIKKQTILVLAFILALITGILTKWSPDYTQYINLRVLALLFCLMVIVAGFRSIHIFDVLADFLLRKANSLRGIILSLLLICFFSSMLITNDVALLMFVPFSIYLLKKHLLEKHLIWLLVLETLAANLGSMFTPIGNPQNLYLFSYFHYSLKEFVVVMFPFTLLSLILLVASIFLFPNKESKLLDLYSSNEQSKTSTLPEQTILTTKHQRSYLTQLIGYCILFGCTIVTVLHIIPYGITLGIVMLGMIYLRPTLFKEVDYFLLLTFVAFFVFVANLSTFPTIHILLSTLTKGREIAVGILASQCISNVPAALLLSTFTSSKNHLLIGVNIGGLGTIIASMASLITYQFYANEKGSRPMIYLLWFTIFNLGFLFLLVLGSLVM